MSDVGTIEISQFPLEDLLHLVHSWIVPHLDHPVVDLPHVHMVDHFIGLNSAFASFLRLMGIELLSVRRSVKNVENVSDHGGSR